PVSESFPARLAAVALVVECEGRGHRAGNERHRHPQPREAVAKRGYVLASAAGDDRGAGSEQAQRAGAVERGAAEPRRTAVNQVEREVPYECERWHALTLTR